ARTGFETPHQLDPVVVGILKLLSRTHEPPGKQYCIRMHWNVYIRDRAWLRTEEFRRNDTRHGKGIVVEPDRLTGGLPHITESTSPQPITQCRHRRRSRRIIFFDDQAAGDWTHTHTLEIVS